MFTNNVPSNPRVHYQIVRAGPAKPLKVCVLTEEWRAVWTHWHGGRTIKCNEEGACIGCQEEVPRRWIGYLGVRQLEGSQVAIAAITPCCAATLLSYRRKIQGLAGLRAVFQRIGRRPNSELTAVPYGYEEDFVPMEMQSLENCIKLLYSTKSSY